MCHHCFYLFSVFILGGGFTPNSAQDLFLTLNKQHLGINPAEIGNQMQCQGSNLGWLYDLSCLPLLFLNLHFLLGDEWKLVLWINEVFMNAITRTGLHSSICAIPVIIVYQFTSKDNYKCAYHSMREGGTLIIKQKKADAKI